MPQQNKPLICPRCSQTFTQSQSLPLSGTLGAALGSRLRREDRVFNAPTRRCGVTCSAPLAASVGRVSCTPATYRSSESTLVEEPDRFSTYVTPDASPPPQGCYGAGVAEPYTTGESVQDRVKRNGLPATAVISEERRKVLLGTAPGTPSNNMVVRHTMHFVIRVLRSWPRLMATYHTAQLPPIIHNSQIVDGALPKPLAHCYTLAKMWDSQVAGSGDLVQSIVLNEHGSYDEADLLAAAQSVLILLIVLFYGSPEGQELSVRAQADLILQLWDVKKRFAATGLFLPEESEKSQHITPPRWQDWAAVSAKRRIILAMHHLEWSWSLRHGYPILTCFELAVVPAPSAGHLWRETDETTWSALYSDWLRHWKDGGVYKIGEFFNVEAEGRLDARSERWLSEADEYGMMLMAEK
ncbi:C6 finger-containing protein [Apiospora saccharicola]|uniref:C6 finger-containing protein n=1 Tax=Apiospora saccharicola TaxID=335842 RepID=A0ABR1VK61_9PEZI